MSKDPRYGNAALNQNATDLEQDSAMTSKFDGDALTEETPFDVTSSRMNPTFFINQAFYYALLGLGNKASLRDGYMYFNVYMDIAEKSAWAQNKLPLNWDELLVSFKESPEYKDERDEFKKMYLLAMFKWKNIMKEMHNLQPLYMPLKL